MRLLHVTDTHLGMRRHLLGAPPNARADDHFRALETALAPAFAGEVDAVLHTGDLFDRSRPPAASVQRAAELWVRLAPVVPIVLMPGNHDRHGLARHLPVPPPNLHLCERPARLQLGPLTVAVVPFCRSAARWAALAAGVVGDGCDLLLAHQAFDGQQVPGFTFRVGQQADTIGEQHLPAGVRHVLSGHLHPRQVVTVGHATVVCPGSTERTSFTERDQTKGYAVWQLGRAQPWRFVDLPARPMVLAHHPRDLATVHPGTLVRLGHPSLRPEAALARGAWVVPPRRPRPAPEPVRQLGLFGQARGRGAPRAPTPG